MISSLAWRPTADISVLQVRARILKIIRDFFAKRYVLEVETPLVSRFGVTDPHITAMQVLLNDKERYYLQTSPEYSMKRLLAAGSGSIYQITRAFRGGDIGGLHNPEFTMLEWYRLGFDHFKLMTEVDEFLQTVLHTKPAKRITYRDLFKQYLSLDPHVAIIEELKNCASGNNINFSDIISAEATLDDWLNILFSTCIEPNLTGDAVWIVYDYPASQAALAKVSDISGIALAERFEVYFQGMELANGYHELTDPKQQLIRFKQDQNIRAQLNKPMMEIDTHLLAAMEFGMPECAGIALGIDRLIMLAVGAKNIQDVMAFPIDRA